MAWLLLLLPILLINPHFTTVTFVPLLLLLAMGLQALFGYWYRLFPRNPYARVAGLIPLVVLVGGLVFSGVERYVYDYHYDPHTASNFSHDLSILNGALENDKQPITLVVSRGEQPFYAVVAKYHHKIELASTLPAKTQTTTYVTHAAHEADQPTATEILTNASSDDANRFYIYKNTD